MITVVILRLYHDPRFPPPTWLRVMVHRCLARIACMRFPTNIAVISGGDVMARYHAGDTVSRQDSDSVEMEGSLPEAHNFINKEGIETV